MQRAARRCSLRSLRIPRRPRQRCWPAAPLVDLGVIEDSSKVWWDLRPSSRFPTIESRICDVAPRMETALTLAALSQSLTRMLWRLAMKNQRWRIYDNFLIAENRWRAQRYGVSEGLVGRTELFRLHQQLATVASFRIFVKPLIFER